MVSPLYRRRVVVAHVHPGVRVKAVILRLLVRVRRFLDKPALAGRGGIRAERNDGDLRKLMG